MTTLAFDALTKRFGDAVAVDALTATVREARVTGFLGPNGAGKTTSLRMLLGLVTPTSGTATVGGRRYADLPQPAREVGVLLEATGFHPGRTGRDHLRVLCTAAGLPTSRADEVLRDVDLAAAGGKQVGQYSLGMRQRLGLAAALLGDPPVLVLDEPANGLDPQGIRWLRDLLRRLAGEGRTVLVSSHVLSEVEQTADDVLVVDRGRLVRTGTVAELRAEGATTRVRTPERARFAALLRDAGHGVTDDGDDLVVSARADVVGELAAAHGVVLHLLAEQGAGLESAFLRMTGLQLTAETAPASARGAA